jgi:hypothetical protein
VKIVDLDVSAEHFSQHQQEHSGRWLNLQSPYAPVCERIHAIYASYTIVYDRACLNWVGYLLWSHNNIRKTKQKRHYFWWNSHWTIWGCGCCSWINSFFYKIENKINLWKQFLTSSYLPSTKKSWSIIQICATTINLSRPLLYLYRDTKVPSKTYSFEKAWIYKRK